MPTYTKKFHGVTIPNFVGAPYYDAQEVAKQTGFELIKDRERPVMGVLPSTIVDQRPRFGTKAKEGRAIFVTVSKTAKQTNVPNLYEKSIREATLLLEEAGLELNPTYEYGYSDVILLDFIIKQEPLALTRVIPGTKVTVVLSQGPEPGRTTVPDIIGLSYEDAVILLRKKNLVAGDPYYKRSLTIDQGRVIIQQPSSNESVELGTTVKITLSSGE